MTPILKNIVMLAVLAVVLYIGYQMFIAGNSNNLDIGGSATAQGALIEKTQEFMNRRAMLTSVILDVDFLKDNRFTSLRSFSTAVPEQSVGRVSIFDKPLSIESSKVTNTQ